MRLADAHTYAVKRLAEFGCSQYAVKFVGTVVTAGLTFECPHVGPHLLISAFHAHYQPDDVVHRIIDHEVAHAIGAKQLGSLTALAAEDSGHGKTWLAALRRLGYEDAGNMISWLEMPGAVDLLAGRHQLEIKVAAFVEASMVESHSTDFFDAERAEEILQREKRSCSGMPVEVPA